MFVIIGLILYVVYVILATKALLTLPKKSLTVFQALLLVVFSAPIIPQVIIGRFRYNKWITVTSILILSLSWICLTAE